MFKGEDKVSNREILLVGTFHFEHLKELVQGKEEDILKIVDLLSKYAPSKIAVEWERDQHDQLNKLYKDNNKEYEMNEIEQLGFRIARKLRHEEIFAVNWMGKLTQEDVVTLNNTIQSTYPEIRENFSTYGAKVEQILLSGGLLHTYQELNKDELRKDTEKLYLSYVPVENNEQTIGVDFLNKWIERELMIFKHVVEIASDDNERILLIVGMDHLWMLKKLFEGNGWTVINPFGQGY